MIRRLQRIKAKRGFTMVELVVVVAIIAVMAATVLFGSSNRREKIQDANMTASDFYSTLQTEVLNLQLFDGPLTMTLNRQYNDPALLKTIKADEAYCGMKYYPAVGGNYPFMGSDPTAEDHLNGLPKEAVLYVEFYAFGGTVRRVNYANSIDKLLSYKGSSGGNNNAELCVVLQQEMEDRMEYREGYYYAKIAYHPPKPADYSHPLTKNDYTNITVKVEWTMYCANEIVYQGSNENPLTFQSQNILRENGVCGVHNSTASSDLGVTGSIIRAY